MKLEGMLSALHGRLIMWSMLLCCGLGVLEAQTGLKWVRRDFSSAPEVSKMGGPSEERSTSVAVDSLGNTYVGTLYRESASAQALAIHRYSRSGDLVWKTKVVLDNAGSGRANVSFFKIETARTGFYVLFGSQVVFQSSNEIRTMDFYSASNQVTPQSSASNLTPTDSTYLGALAFFGYDGTHQWNRPFRASLGAPSFGYTFFDIRDLEVDGDDVYFLANMEWSDFVGRVSAFSGTGVVTPFINLNAGNCQNNVTSVPAVFKYTQFGAVAWVRGMLVGGSSGGNFGFSRATDLEVENGAGYLYGSFQGSLNNWVDLLGTNGGTPLNCSSFNAANEAQGQDLFVLKFEANGSRNWQKRFGGPGFETPVDLGVYRGNIYAVLYTTSTSSSFQTQFMFTDGSFYNVTQRGLYLLNIQNDNADVTTTINWAQAITNPSAFISIFNGDFLTFDKDNNIYLTSNLTQSHDYYTNPLRAGSLSLTGSSASSINGAMDIVLAKYRPTGVLDYTKTIGGNNTEVALSIAMEGEDLLLSGYFFGVTDFEPSSALSVELTSLGESDGFVARYGCWRTDVARTPDTLCAGTPVTLTANTGCPTGRCDFRYTWIDPSNGSSLVLNTNQNILALPLGTNLRYLRLEDAITGCSTTDTVALQVNPAVSVTAAPSSAVICAGSSINFSASANLAGANFRWFRDNVEVGVGATFSATQPGTYVARGNLNGCTAQQSVVLNNFSRFSPRVAPDTASICGTGGALLQVLDCPGCNFSWVPPVGSTAISSSAGLIADVPGLYQVNMADANGCLYNLTKTVNVRPFLSPSIISNNGAGFATNTICNGQPLVLNTTSDPSVCPTCTYQWNDGTTGPFAFAFSQGDYVVTVTDILTGCVGTSTALRVRSSLLPTPQATGNPLARCSPSLMARLFVDNICTGCSYEWFANGNPTAVLSDTSFFFAASSGDYLVRVRDSLGCRATSSVLMVSEGNASQPNLSATGSSICPNSQVTLSTAACTDCNYRWYRNDTLIVGANQPSYTTAVAGVFKAEVQYANTCIRASDTLSVLQDAFFPRIGSVKTTAQGFICDVIPDTLGITGDSTLVAGTSNSFLLPPRWQYQWYYNGSPIAGQNGHRLTTIGTGDYYLQVTNSSGCQSNSNIFRVRRATRGANPTISIAPDHICLDTLGVPTEMVLTTQFVDSCSYQWLNELNVLVPVANLATPNIFTANTASGYYVRVTDTISRCVYTSALREVRDTIYPTPFLQANTANICATAPVITSATACSGCSYYWYRNAGSGPFLSQVTNQNTLTVDSSGSYFVEVIRDNGCPSPPSNEVSISFAASNVQLITPPVSNICNGSPVLVRAVPDRTACPDCRYLWFRDNIPVVQSDTLNTYSAVQSGNYSVVVQNGAGCRDTSVSLRIDTVNYNVQLFSTARAFCGSTSGVTLFTNRRIPGASYAWYLGVDTFGLGGTILNGQQDTALSLIGSALAGRYRLEVSSQNCVVTDTISIDTAPPLVFRLDTFPHANVCAGTPVILSVIDTSCARCNPIGFQWFKNGTAIPGAITASYLADTTGVYTVSALDSSGCRATSGPTSITSINPVAGFRLIFDTLGTVPLSAGSIPMKDYLFPASLRTDTSGRFNSFTAGSAVNAITGAFQPSLAGPGRHIINFSYRSGSCVFTTTDTLEVLQPMAADVINLNPSAPVYEACLTDTILVELTNFTFVPNLVEFTTVGTQVIGVTPFNVNVTQSSGVWTGSFRVRVPVGARTGKLWLKNATDAFQTPFFFVVQNPTVSISLADGLTRICSTTDSIGLEASPIGGIFRVAYLDDSTTFYPQYIFNNKLIVDSIQDYNDSLRAALQISYLFQTRYSNGQVCAIPPLVGRLNVNAFNVDLDGIDYTPLSITQASEGMRNLTRRVLPIPNRNLNFAYSGTYIAANNILPSTINTGPGPQPVTYQVNNGGCLNSRIDSLPIIPAPSILDSLPADICQSPDTIFIGRDAQGLYLERVVDGQLIITRTDSMYALVDTTFADGFTYNLAETRNLLTLTSSQGGLIPIDVTPGLERYALIPTLIATDTTTLSLRFDYQRIDNYYFPTTTFNQVSYTIARVQKTVLFEQPVAAQVNPAIAADTVFCFVSQNVQLTGIPAGGQYSLSPYAQNNFTTLVGNVFNPVNTGPGHYDLRYVYRGRACVDSTTIGIRVATPFTVDSIRGVRRSFPNYCEREAPDSIRIVVSPSGLPIDYGSGVFSVAGLPAGQFFNPARARTSTAPVTDAVVVSYSIADSFGCRQAATDTFFVHPTPRITLTLNQDTATPLTNLNLRYCLNDPNLALGVSASTVNNVGATYALFSTRGGLINGSNPPSTLPPSNASFVHQLLGVGTDTIVYTYVDGFQCTETIRQPIRVLPLPILTMGTFGGQALPNFLCEGDSLPVFGAPFNVTSTFASVYNTNASSGSNLVLVPGAAAMVARIAAPNVDTVSEQIIYTYRDLSTGCQDTIAHTFEIRNLAEPSFTGLPLTAICASPNSYDLEINTPIGGAIIDSAQYLVSPSTASAALRRVDNFNAVFRPDSAQVLFHPNRILITYRHRSHGTCWGQDTTSVFIYPLPQLLLTNPGDVITTVNDPRLHICESQDSVLMRAFLRTSSTLGSPVVNNLIAPDSTANYRGRYLQGTGIVRNPITEQYFYLASAATQSIDTIIYEFTDTFGCVNTVREIVVVDTIPDLSFAGLDPLQFDSLSGRYVYCQNDPPILVVPSPFGGILSFGQQVIPSGLLNLSFDSLPMPANGAYRFDTLTYRYVAARYASRPACEDLTNQVIEIRPIPQLQFVTLPNQICLVDTALIPLRAQPQGGTFLDLTQPSVPSAIINDTLFNALAQAGNRRLAYAYFDPTTGCRNAIEQVVTVYSAPRPRFETEGGCALSPIIFRTDSTGLSNIPPAVDSINFLVWDYGNGVVDTVRNIANPAVIPNRNYTYSAPGIYQPSLTIVNQGQCAQTFSQRVVVSPKIQPLATVPYTENFQNGAGNWFQEEIQADTIVRRDTLWHLALATGRRIGLAPDRPANFMWITNPSGAYPAGKRAWVYSPCFDLSDLDKPMIKMDIWRDSREGIDGAVLEFYDTTNNQWRPLGQVDKGINWFNPPFILARPGNQVGAPPIGWSGSGGQWEDARYRLDAPNFDLRGRTNVRFRVAFASSPSTVNPSQGGLEGFAFDRVMVGNRTKKVLVEHFSQQGHPGLVATENNLYQTLFSNLYGRDVILVQYQTERNPNLPQDPFYLAASTEANARILHRNITNNGQVRLNGEDSLGTTAVLLQNLERLDMEMLRDDSIRIYLPPLNIRNSILEVEGAVIATKDLPMQDYAIFTMIVQDSIQSSQRHMMRNVMRTVLPQSDGWILLNEDWAVGDSLALNWSWNIGGIPPNRLEAVIIVEDRATKRVYQAATTRDLSVFQGPVVVEQLQPEDGLEILDLVLFPNPARDHFSVRFSEPLQGEYRWRLFDIQGRTLRHGLAASGTDLMQVYTDDLPSGTYVFALDNGLVYVQRKVIVARP